MVVNRRVVPLTVVQNIRNAIALFFHVLRVEIYVAGNGIREIDLLAEVFIQIPTIKLINLTVFRLTFRISLLRFGGQTFGCAQCVELRDCPIRSTCIEQVITNAVNAFCNDFNRTVYVQTVVVVGNLVRCDNDLFNIVFGIDAFILVLECSINRIPSVAASRCFVCRTRRTVRPAQNTGHLIVIDVGPNNISSVDRAAITKVVPVARIVGSRVTAGGFDVIELCGGNFLFRCGNRNGLLCRNRTCVYGNGRSTYGFTRNFTVCINSQNAFIIGLPSKRCFCVARRKACGKLNAVVNLNGIRTGKCNAGRCNRFGNGNGEGFRLHVVVPIAPVGRAAICMRNRHGARTFTGYNATVRNRRNGSV